MSFPHVVPHAWPRTDERTRVERVLGGLGAEPSFAEAVLGDLAEERARRAEHEGAAAARLWYLREALRAAPHLLWNALRHGGPRGQARAAAIVGAVAGIPVLALMFIVLRPGPPARLLLDLRHTGEGVVLNHRGPVQLAVRALDARGHELSAAGTRYEWFGGIRIPVSTSGVIECWRSGNAYVRASLGEARGVFPIMCRPIMGLQAPWDMRLTLGDAPRPLEFAAFDRERRRVTELSGELHIADSTIATLRNGKVIPLAAGHTVASMEIGDDKSRTEITVYEPVTSFTGLRDDQQLVVAPVRVAYGDTVTWPMPRGHFGISYTRVSETDAVPTVTVDGPAVCSRGWDGDAPSASCRVRGAGVKVIIAHPGSSRRPATGKLWLGRWFSK